ncbi:hypothetical protein DFH07DRAFT_931954 [Mycena maculata]|uniref:Uncharacterized protein n=1 Tax=Mycena maculata TaxID=230809 RepID=A0AAD7HM78_9AGAR|nr:hypothetical protein DFH07DRAFT_931954 [Mycena maculata]
MIQILNHLRLNATDWILEGLENVKYFYDLRLLQYAPLIAKLDSQSIILPGFAVCAVLVALVFRVSKGPKHPSNPSESLLALFSVIAPTSVAWPREYTRLVDYSASPRSKTVAVSMESFIDGLCGGIIEVRNCTDLPDLFSDKLVVYGWRITLALDSSWNLTVLRWVVGSHFAWTRTQPAPKHKTLKRAHGASIPKEDTTADSLSCSLTANVHLDLDRIPFSHFETSLLQLRATLAPGTFATLEFTTPAAHVAFLSPQFNICAVPFLPRQHIRSPSTVRPATPLLGSVHRVLELLTAGPSAFALENVSNVSRTYAEALGAAAARLKDDRAARTAFIQQWEITGWREQRLMMGWEAALFSVGYLTRWVVVVRK